MRNMKDSGIEWIGEIPEDWNLRSIKSIIDNVKNEKNSSYDTKVLSLSINGVKIKQNLNEGMNPESYIGHQLVSEGDLVICLRDLDGPLLCGVSKYDGCLSNLYYVINFKDANAHFLDYLFHSMDYIDILDGFSYGMRHSYNISQFGCFNIPIPTIEEQELIVDYLDNKVKEIDNIISKTKETIEEYKKYKQSIITEAVTKGLNPNVEMKDSGIEWIGEIPKDWSVIKLKKCSNLKGRIGWQGLKSTEFTDEGPYLITGTDFINGEINWNNCAHISKERFEEAPEIHIKNGDLLITKDGTIGKLAIAKNTPKEVSLNSGVLLIRKSNDYTYIEKYLYYVLMSEQFWFWFNRSLTGNSTIIHLYQEKFKQFMFSLPSIDMQEEIVKYLDKKCNEIDNLISKKEQLIIQLEQYKKSLIYECVTGKKEVSPAYAD